jgi:hypothetical protein
LTNKNSPPILPPVRGNILPNQTKTTQEEKNYQINEHCLVGAALE